ncbi:MAG TPA: hypothetical protein VFV67_35990 [Actinophytocola sp.]|uniref:hypothetical protein n=1 Tax=Actinophytocola sp. TaxID=1872138 RepID=UPI002DBB2F90|nr:hypothetical protein [Actinophytocola sp.]HEU5476059.1 hypothetical protein [Actinophytocola sp.]
MTDGPDWARPDPQPTPPPNMPPPPPGWAAEVAKPGVIPLRPLGVGEILDGAITTMRRHPKLTLGIAAVVVLVSELITLALTLPWLDDVNRAVDQSTPPDVAADVLVKSLGVTGIAVLVTLIAQVFLSGFLTVVVGKAVLGRPTSFREEWARVRPRLPALLVMTLIYIGVAVGAVLIAALIAAAVPPLAPVVAIGLIVVGIWLLILFSLSTPALMLENATIGRAFGRSRRLVRGSWWRIFGITLLTWLISVIVALIITLPFQLIGGAYNEATATSTTAIILGTIGGIIAGTITDPFAAGVTVLLYTDQRMRREGMDIELARAAQQ